MRVSLFAEIMYSWSVHGEGLCGGAWVIDKQFAFDSNLQGVPGLLQHKSM